MAFKLKLNSTTKILKDKGLDENGYLTAVFRNTVDRFCDPYVPMETGTLKNTKTYPNTHCIKYMSPYAHYLYKGILMVSPTTGSSFAEKGETKIYTGKSLKYQGGPKRGANWDKRMMNDRKGDVLKTLQQAIK